MFAFLAATTGLTLGALLMGRPTDPPWVLVKRWADARWTVSELLSPDLVITVGDELDLNLRSEAAHLDACHVYILADGSGGPPVLFATNAAGKLRFAFSYGRTPPMRESRTAVYRYAGVTPPRELGTDLRPGPAPRERIEFEDIEERFDILPVPTPVEAVAGDRRRR